MIRSIFLPSGNTCLTRGPYILTFILLHIIYLTIALNLDEWPIVLLICMLVYTWVKVNINAQRSRDSGAKARYVVTASIVVYLVSAVLGYFFGADCASLAYKLNIGFDLLVFLIFTLAPTQLKTTN
ncbi:DUF805 domain-containing protein [Kosakonia sp. BK9b]